jgi:hypothetical protein
VVRAHALSLPSGALKTELVIGPMYQRAGATKEVGSISLAFDEKDIERCLAVAAMLGQNIALFPAWSLALTEELENFNQQQVHLYPS